MVAVTYLFTGFIFGWAKPVPISPFYFKNHQKGMALVGIAGPATNFCLAAVFWAVLRLLQPTLIAMPGYANGSVQLAVAKILLLGLELNVVLGLFNLVPIPPLDGSRILGAFLPPKQYVRWASLDQYGWVFIIALILILNYSGSSVIANAYASLFHWLLPGYYV
jgi:Zn-dependent protease